MTCKCIGLFCFSPLSVYPGVSLHDNVRATSKEHRLLPQTQEQRTVEEEVLPGGGLWLEEQGGLGQSCFEITPQALGPDMSRTLPSSQRGLEKL